MLQTNHKWIRAIRWTVLSLLGLAFAWPACAQSVTTTTVAGTVYLAGGAPGSGTVQISWPAFTTSANQPIVAGHTSVTIGADGFLSVNLAPNLGATPAGLFYTAVYHMSDGTTSTEYWVVPAAAQAAIAQVRSQVMPAAQAAQAVSKSYVDQAIALINQSSFDASGGTLTGPLFLSGDPTQSLQASDKHYVDSQFSQAVPLTGAALTGPLTATQLGAAFQADQFPGADFGARLQACLAALNSTYGGTCDARNFSGTLSMASNLTISAANATVLLPCATISTAAQIVIPAGTRNVSLRGCSLRGASTASGSQGGTVFLYSGAASMIQVGDPTYAADTLGFHLDNVVINTTASNAATAAGFAAYRAQELDLQSLYFLGNSNQTGMTLDGTGNYTGGSFYDNAFNGFQIAVNAIGHQVANPATTDWLNASTFVRLHIDCPASNGSPIAGTTGINLAQGDGNTFTGGDVEGCSSALHLGPNAQNNTIVGLRNEGSTKQVVADSGSSYNNWITGGTMFTGSLIDNGTRNSFLDTFHRSFNGLNGDWYGSQQDATVTNHFRIGIGNGNERGLLNRYQTDYGYRWTTGLSDATAGEQFYHVLDELNNVYRISIGQYNNGQASTNNQTVVNAAGTGAVVLNGSNNSGTGGLVLGSGGPAETTVATINNAGNAQFNGTLQVGGASTFINSTTVRNTADAEIDANLWAGATTNQKESFIYKDFTGASQWFMVKDAANNWALNSATGGLDSFKAYQNTNSGDTYINASNSSGAVRVNYETGTGTAFNIYGGNSATLYASFTGTSSIKFPGLAASSGTNCVQIDSSGYLSKTGSACGSGSGSGTVNSGTNGQIAYYNSTGAVISGINAVPVTAGGTGATTASSALAALAGASLSTSSVQNFSGALTAPSVSASVNKVLLVTAPPYNAKCDGSTDDQAAIQSAFNDAKASGYSVQFPAGTCKTSTIQWYGQAFFGAGANLTIIQGKPGQDVFATPDSAVALLQYAYVHDLTINVDSSVNKAATAVGGDNSFPNRISGTAGGVSNPIPAAFGGPPAPGPAYLSSGGVISATSTALTLAGGLFTNAPSYLVVGAPITVNGAGVSGANLVTTIASVTNSTHVVLSAAASTTVSNAAVTWGNGNTPPWYFGNCAIAVPASSGAAMSTNDLQWTFRNVIINDSNDPYSSGMGNYACGIFLQNNYYGFVYENVAVNHLWGGIVDAPPVSNLTAFGDYQPDVSVYTNLTLAYNAIPMVWYNGTHRRVNAITIYNGGPEQVGLFQLQVPLGSSGQDFPSATIQDFYVDCWGGLSGEYMRFSSNGSMDIVNGGNLSQCGNTSYVNWIGNWGFVNAQIGSTLHITGNQNTFLNTNLPIGEVVDNGFDNSVGAGQTGTSLQFARNYYANQPVPQAPVNLLNGDFLLNGNSQTPFVSGSDLVTTCRDWVGFTGGGSGTCVADPNDTANIAKSYIQSPNASGVGTVVNGTTNNFLFVLGARIPLTKVYIVTSGECVGSSSCASVLKINDVTTSTQIGANCTVAYTNAWTTQGGPLSNNVCLIDFSSATPGDYIGWTLNNFSGSPSSFRIAYIAFEPVQNDVIAEMAAANYTTQNSASAIAGGTVNVNATNWAWNTSANPGVQDSTSPIGYSTPIQGAWTLYSYQGNTNLNGGSMYPAVPSVVSYLLQAPAVITDTLGASQASGDTTITVANSQSAWGSSGCLKVDQEIECYTGSAAVGMTTYTVTRAQYGTLAQPHSNGATYVSLGTATMNVNCNSITYASTTVLFTPAWTYYSSPFSGQNCSGYATQFKLQSPNGPTGQTYKIASLTISQQSLLPTATAAAAVPVSVSGSGGQYPFTSTRLLGGAGTGIPTGPTSGVTSGHSVCYTGTSGQQADCGSVGQVLTATTASIGGSSLTAGTCTSGTVSVPNSATGMAVAVSPATYPGDNFDWRAYVSAAGTVTVKICNATSTSATPTASTYNVRVIQ